MTITATDLSLTACEDRLAEQRRTLAILDEAIRWAEAESKQADSHWMQDIWADLFNGADLADDTPLIECETFGCLAFHIVSTADHITIGSMDSIIWPERARQITGLGPSVASLFWNGDNTLDMIKALRDAYAAEYGIHPAHQNTAENRAWATQAIDHATTIDTLQAQLVELQAELATSRAAEASPTVQAQLVELQAQLAASSHAAEAELTGSRA